MIDQLIVTNDYLTLILKVLVFTNMSFLFLFGFRAIIIKLIDAFSKSEQKPLPIKKVFPDPALADYILQEMNKRVGVFKASTDDLISEEDLQYITKVNLENKGIKSIKGIDKLVNCKEISNFSKTTTFRFAI